MTLNINTTSNNALSSGRHRRLKDAVLNEILSWNPREFISAFRRWHHGSFSLIHLNVLTLLDTDGPDSMSHLAEALDVSVASMTGIVDRMEKRGLVERRHGGTDRRVVKVYPTETGLDVFREIDLRRREGLGRLLDQLNDDDLAGLLSGHRALRKVRTAAAAARGAAATGTGTVEGGSTAPTTPPRLHGPSTIRSDDAPVEPPRAPGR